VATWTKTTAAPAARKESASGTALSITSAVARGSAGKNDDAPLQVDQDVCGLTGVKLGDRHGSLLQVVDRR